MSRGKKALGIILSLVLLTILLPVAFSHSPYFDFPLSLYERNVISYSPFQYFWRQYSFWVASILSLLVIILLLVLIFYPKTKQVFILNEDGGRLSIDKKAIEGLVRSHLREKEFVDQPKVNVTGTKNKINIAIKGELKRTSSLVGKTNALMTRIQQEVKHTLGTEENIQVAVTYTDFTKDKNTKTQKPRVI